MEELEDTLDVQDVEDLRELSKLREKTRNRGYQPSSSASSHAAFGSRQSTLSGGGRGNGSTEETRNSKLVVMTATVSDTGLVIRSVWRKTKMMCRHMSRVVLCRKQCTFSMRHLLSSHRCGSGVDERLCPFTQKKADIEVLGAALSGTFQVWSR